MDSTDLFKAMNLFVSGKNGLLPDLHNAGFNKDTV